jgi:hypothetical protein
VPHAELSAHLRADQPGRAAQRRRRVVDGVGVTQHGVEHGGLLGVAGHPHVGDGHEPQPRVLDPPLQHLGDDHLDAVGDLADAGRGHDVLQLGAGVPG